LIRETNKNINKEGAHTLGVDLGASLGPGAAANRVLPVLEAATYPFLII